MVSAVHAQRIPRRLLSRRTLQIALGVLWLLDGVLQLQPFMLSPTFARTVIAPAATRQPFFVANLVSWNAHLIAGHPVLFDGVIASIQLALGIGFLIRNAAKAAIVVSVVWAGGVWYFGEGLGGLAGGRVSALVGAPGAALLYAVLALATWPGATSPSPSTSTRLQAPPRWTLSVWALLWGGFAVLSALPANDSGPALSRQVQANVAVVPAPLASIDRMVAHAARAGGDGTVALVVMVELAVGLLAFGRRRVRNAAVVGGIIVAGFYWVVGQSFGQLLSGRATDPNTGPLIVLLGLTVLAGMAGTTDTARILPGSMPERPRGSIGRAIVGHGIEGTLASHRVVGVEVTGGANS